MTANPPTDLEKFIRWFVTPYRTLKPLPDGDGAFAALSIGFLLCERYYKIKHTLPEDDKSIFKNKAAEDMDINMEFFSIFWSTFRNGLMHKGSPQTYERAGIIYKWRISHLFDAFPTYYDKDGFRFICLDPWKFTDHIISQFLEHPEHINGSIAYALGHILTEELAHTRQPVLFSHPYPN